MAIDKHQHAPGERSAVRSAERIAERSLGALVYSRVGDPELGEFDPAIEVARFGSVPSELADLVLRD